MSYDHILTTDERVELLRIARTTVKEFLISGRTPPGAPHRSSLTTPAGVFVSFHEAEYLRGCIGTTLETQPIYKAVQDMAVAAATRDPRYRPVRVDELPAMIIEISVLGERRTVTSPSEIELGVHGLQVTAPAGPRPARGLLLPKVAVEQGWDIETFLTRTCEKADLAADFWRRALAGGDEGVVERFTAQVFDEKTLRTGPFAPTTA